MLVLPFEGKSLDEVINSMNLAVLTKIIREKSLKHAKLHIPLFTLKQEVKLKPILWKVRYFLILYFSLSNTPSSLAQSHVKNHSLTSD